MSLPVLAEGCSRCTAAFCWKANERNAEKRSAEMDGEEDTCLPKGCATDAGFIIAFVYSVAAWEKPSSDWLSFRVCCSTTGRGQNPSAPPLKPSQTQNYEQIKRKKMLRLRKRAEITRPVWSSIMNPFLNEQSVLFKGLHLDTFRTQMSANVRISYRVSSAAAGTISREQPGGPPALPAVDRLHGALRPRRRCLPKWPLLRRAENPGEEMEKSKWKQPIIRSNGGRSRIRSGRERNSQNVKGSYSYMRRCEVAVCDTIICPAKNKFHTVIVYIHASHKRKNKHTLCKPELSVQLHHLWMDIYIFIQLLFIQDK